MAKRAEAALGFLRNHLLFPSCLHSPVPWGFTLAPGDQPEREAVDSTLPDGSACSGFSVPH